VISLRRRLFTHQRAVRPRDVLQGHVLPSKLFMLRGLSTSVTVPVIAARPLAGWKPE
jgi:hypothetical protein